MKRTGLALPGFLWWGASKRSSANSLLLFLPPAFISSIPLLLHLHPRRFHHHRWILHHCYNSPPPPLPSSVNRETWFHFIRHILKTPPMTIVRLPRMKPSLSLTTASTYQQLLANISADMVLKFGSSTNGVRNRNASSSCFRSVPPFQRPTRAKKAPGYPTNHQFNSSNNFSSTDCWSMECTCTTTGALVHALPLGVGMHVLVHVCQLIC